MQPPPLCSAQIHCSEDFLISIHKNLSNGSIKISNGFRPTTYSRTRFNDFLMTLLVFEKYLKTSRRWKFNAAISVLYGEWRTIHFWIVDMRGMKICIVIQKSKEVSLFLLITDAAQTLQKSWVQGMDFLFNVFLLLFKAFIQAMSDNAFFAGCIVALVICPNFEGFKFLW